MENHSSKDLTQQSHETKTTAKKSLEKNHPTESIGMHNIKDVLYGHLTAKLEEHCPDVNIVTIATALINRYPESYIFTLLQNAELLKKNVTEINATETSTTENSCPLRSISTIVDTSYDNAKAGSKSSERKSAIGEVLFNKVAELESELCAQITGMLLEMEISALEGLVDDDTKLEAAVLKAKSEYLSQRHPDVLASKEEIGEEIYECLLTTYPQKAAKITGMLLELDVVELHQLLENQSQLQAKASLAYQALKKIKN